MSKKIIRKKMLTFLTNFQTSEEKKIQEMHMLNKFYEDDLWLKSQTIGITLSLPIEFNTGPLIKKAIKQGKRVAIPKTFSNGKMSFYYYDQMTSLEKSSFGILEPVDSDEIQKNQLDLLIVPGIAFTPTGYRVGFGGGYYDRYLQNFNNQTASFLFKQQLVPDFKHEEFDMAVDKLYIGQS